MCFNRVRADAREVRVPRTIWSLWLQGWDASPEVVRACRRTWEALNPSWTFRALDRDSLAAVLAPDAMRGLDPASDMPPEAVSDIARVELLRRFGGVWADATTYCLRPLDAWLPDVTTSGFFAFAKPGPDRMISTWFLAARPRNALVGHWAERTRRYWIGRSERGHYFWFHYLFAEGYACDVESRRIWDGTPEVLADGPHFYEPGYEKLWARVSERGVTAVDFPFAPLLKLTHKVPPGEYPPDSVIRYLCDRAFARVSPGA